MVGPKGSGSFQAQSRPLLPPEQRNYPPSVKASLSGEECNFTRPTPDCLNGVAPAVPSTKLWTKLPLPVFKDLFWSGSLGFLNLSPACP